MVSAGLAYAPVWTSGSWMISCILWSVGLSHMSGGWHAVSQDSSDLMWGVGKGKSVDSMSHCKGVHVGGGEEFLTIFITYHYT